MNPQVAGSYAGEVAVLKQYIKDRIKWMDTKLNYVPSTGLDDIRTPEISGRKILINNQLVIMRNGKHYNAQGIMIH